MYLRTVFGSRPVRRAIAVTRQPLSMQFQDHHQFSKLNHRRRLPRERDGTDVGSTLQPGLAPAEGLAGMPTREFSKPTIGENRRTDDTPSIVGAAWTGSVPRWACRNAGRVAYSARAINPSYVRLVAEDEAALTAAIVARASEFGRYGYRRVTALLKRDGWQVNHKRVERFWRQEGLKVPKRQPKRGRLWLNDGSCVCLRPCWPNHVSAYDFVEDRTHDGRKFRLLTMIDEYTRECLAIEVARHLRADDVLHQLTELFVERSAPRPHPLG
jgi:putative transposase